MDGGRLVLPCSNTLLSEYKLSLCDESQLKELEIVFLVWASKEIYGAFRGNLIFAFLH